MIGLHVWQEIRVFFGLAAVFAVLPWVLARKEGTGSSWLLWTLRTVLFAEVAGLVLGRERLCLPGAMCSALLLFVGGALLVEGFDRPVAWRTGLISIFRSAPWLLTLSAPLLLSQLSDLVRRTIKRLPCRGLWVAAAAFVCLYPLQHVRFINGHSYERVLSLDVLTWGEAWKPDGSVAFLAPAMFLSGEDGAAMIRFANPLLIAMLVATAGFAVWELTGSRWGAFTSAATLFGAALFSRGGGELGSGAIAAIPWLLAIVLLNRYSWDAGFAAALALMIE